MKCAIHAEMHQQNYHASIHCFEKSISAPCLLLCHIFSSDSYGVGDVQSPFENEVWYNTNDMQHFYLPDVFIL